MMRYTKPIWRAGFPRMVLGYNLTLFRKARAIRGRRDGTSCRRFAPMVDLRNRLLIEFWILAFLPTLNLIRAKQECITSHAGTPVRSSASG